MLVGSRPPHLLCFGFAVVEHLVDSIGFHSSITSEVPLLKMVCFTAVCKLAPSGFGKDLQRRSVLLSQADHFFTATRRKTDQHLILFATAPFSFRYRPEKTVSKPIGTAQFLQITEKAVRNIHSGWQRWRCICYKFISQWKRNKLWMTMDTASGQQIAQLFTGPAKPTGMGKQITSLQTSSFYLFDKLHNTYAHLIGILSREC